MGQPLVSVIVTSFNRADRVTRALRSIRDQTYPDLEVIVVDDASTDGSPKVIEPLLTPRDRLIVRQMNGGQNAALNAGLAVASGEIIAFCDSDDVLLPEFIARTVQPLIDDLRLGFSYCRLECGPAWTIEGCNRLGPALEQGHLSALGTLAVRRSALDDVLPLPERLVPGDMCQDDRLCFELARRHCFAHVPQELYRIIGAPDSVTKDDHAQVVGWDRLFTDYGEDIRLLCAPGTLARHRAANVERAAWAGDQRTTGRLAADAIREAMTGPRKARELLILVPALAGSFLRLLIRWLLSRLQRG